MSSKDIALKDIFEEIPRRLSKILAPAPIKELLPTNFPSTELRVDFLARLEDESILHIEFQSFNDINMPFRMLRYYLAILERYPSTPIKQLLVYVGNRKLRIKSRLRIRNLSFSYEVLDIRQIDCEDEVYLIEKLIKTMEGMNEEERKDYLLKALTLTELRPNLRIKLTEEVKHMPIMVRPEDIRLPKRKLRKDILYRLGLEEGKQIGFQEGEVIGIEKGKQIGFQEGEAIGIEKGKHIGLGEGKQIGLEEGLLKSAQEMLIAIIEGKLGYVPEEIANRIREVKDVEFLRSLAKKLVSASEDFMQVLATELKIL